MSTIFERSKTAMLNNMEICDGTSHNDSGTKTLLFLKWEGEDKLKKN